MSFHSSSIVQTMGFCFLCRFIHQILFVKDSSTASQQLLPDGRATDIKTAKTEKCFSFNTLEYLGYDYVGKPKKCWSNAISICVYKIPVLFLFVTPHSPFASLQFHSAKERWSEENQFKLMRMYLHLHCNNSCAILHQRKHAQAFEMCRVTNRPEQWLNDMN